MMEILILFSRIILIIPKHDLLSPNGSFDPVAFISIAIKPTKLSILSEKDKIADSGIEGHLSEGPRGEYCSLIAIDTSCG